MKKILEKKEYLVITLIIILFIFVSYLSLTSIHQLRGNARVVNYVGIVRGATQKLIKKELQGYKDDPLIARLDSIVNELLTGKGPNNLVLLHDDRYLDNMGQVKIRWGQLKEEISEVRKGADRLKLFELSEEYFILVDRTVSSAEAFSETQVNRSTNILLGVNGVFILIMIMAVISSLRSIALKKRAESLDKIAYIDPLTQMPNRASCERELGKYTKEPPENDIAVFMFDMNNLKKVNDMIGHQGGDRVIADFARILKTESAEFGFAGRYGGDEFISILPNADERVVNNYLAQINEKIVAYNLLHVKELEKLSFAAGYIIANLKNMTIDSIIYEADIRMYARKRQMKENKGE